MKVSPDYTTIRVYWIPKIDADNKAIQELLDEAARPLRREMCHLNVTGLVPPIRFIEGAISMGEPINPNAIFVIIGNVKLGFPDKYHSMMVEIDRRLKIADFGENFTPTIVTDDILKGELQLHTHLPVQIRVGCIILKLD